jgi:hypothetical protein
MIVAFAWLLPVLAEPIWGREDADIEGARIAVITVFVTKALRIFGIGNAILLTAPHQAQRQNAHKS